MTGLYVAIGIMSVMLLALFILTLPMIAFVFISISDHRPLAVVFYITLIGILCFVMFLGGSVWHDYYQLITQGLV